MGAGNENVFYRPIERVYQQLARLDTQDPTFLIFYQRLRQHCRPKFDQSIHICQHHELIISDNAHQMPTLTNKEILHQYLLQNRLQMRL